jgi:hypothetical protein
MKLIIRRNQQAQKGVFGGHKGMSFILSCRIELTSEERSLVEKYKAENYPLTFVTRDGHQIPSITVSTLLGGISEEVRDISILLSNEETIKSACQNFKQLLTVMATFGGEEVVEI